MDALNPSGNSPHIVIVGGGASGTLTAVHLLRHAAATGTGAGLHITLVDAAGRHGLGLAYSTRHPAHLLNARAGQMSALDGVPGDLLAWTAAGGRGQLPPGGEITPATFLPRAAYGRYLLDTLASAQQAAPGVTLRQLTAEVSALHRDDAAPAAGGGPAPRPVCLHLAGGTTLRADYAVLATGNLPGAFPFAVPATPRVIADPWAPGALDGLLADSPADGSAAADGSGPAVVIAGTGLTMIDLAIAVCGARPGAVVHAVSRHGLLPRTHPGTLPRNSGPLWLPVLARTTAPVRLTELMWQVRAAISASPDDWPEVMFALRPLVPGLWRHLPIADRQLFLRRLARYWEVHRHLMPPATAARVAALRSAGRLVVHSGGVRDVAAVFGGTLAVTVAAAGQPPATIAADWLVNGTGPAADITQASSPLLHQLMSTGQARPDPLRLGIDATTAGAVLSADGEPSDVLFTLGPPLRGVWYETTAVPEIRHQAAALARHLLSAAYLGRPVSAAV